MEEGLEGNSGLGVAHERFADEEGVEAGVAEGTDVGGGVDAAFGDANGVGRELAGEFERGFEADFEGLQIAVIHAVGVAADVPNEVDLLRRVDFAEDVQAIAMGDGRVVVKVAVAERAGNEEDGVGVVGASFGDLILVDDEILAEAGQAGGGGGDFEVLQAALEEGLVGEDGEGGCPGAFEVDGEGTRVEVGADETL